MAAYEADDNKVGVGEISGASGIAKDVPFCFGIRNSEEDVMKLVTASRALVDYVGIWVALILPKVWHPGISALQHLTSSLNPLVRA